MPDKGMWEQFFVPNEILTILGMDRKVTDAVEFGCGYGTFTIPAAKIIRGTLYALDIDPSMIHETVNQVKKNGLDNVKVLQRDFVEHGSGLPDESMNYVMLFNILHLENPVSLLSETRRILKKGGTAGIIHWNYDPTTPRGPSMDIRPKPEDCIQWTEEAGFTNPKQYDLKPYHYGIILKK